MSTMESKKRSVPFQTPLPANIVPEKRSRGRPRLREEPSAGDPLETSTERLTQQILTSLMTNDPLDLGDIMISTRTHFTADVVQGILDVLVITGLVSRLYLRDAGTNDEDSLDILAKEKKRTNMSYYALKGYCRCSEGVDVRKLNNPQTTEAKLADIKALEIRIQALQELTLSTNMSSRERAQALKNIMQKSLIENKNLAIDPLYTALGNILSTI